MAQRRSPLTRRVIAGPTMLALSVLLVGHVPAAQAGNPCVITNRTQPSGNHSTLQSAVNAATGGDTLQVKGLCQGSTEIGKRLTIVGKTTPSLGTPTLDGATASRVLQVLPGKTVSISDLTITFGVAPGDPGDRYGGNILNEGTLTLTRVRLENGNADRGGGIHTTGTLTVIDSVVTGNEAQDGAGIHAYGPVTLRGTTQVHGNLADRDGGGLLLIGDLTLGGSAAVHHNTATGNGGGIWFGRSQAPGGVLRMGGTSSVRANEAGVGGGVYLYGTTALLSGDSTIRNNRAREGGGAYLEDASLTLDGDASVRNNRAEAAGGIGSHVVGAWARLKLLGRSTVKSNRATDQIGGIILVGTLTMRDRAVVRDNVDEGGWAAVAIGSTPDRRASLTMSDQSRVTSHRNGVELGPDGAAVRTFGFCEPVKLTGVKARVVGNTPKNLVVGTDPC